MAGDVLNQIAMSPYSTGAKASAAGALALSGATAARPTSVPVGTCFYDTTLNKPVWLKAAGSWVDATGTAA